MRSLLRSLIVAGSIVLPSVAHAQSKQAPIAPRWCTDSTQKGDSAFVVARAVRAIADSTRNSNPLKVDDIQVIKTASLKQGIIVSLVSANPRTLGGGGLVWIDAETFCAIVLRLYE